MTYSKRLPDNSPTNQLAISQVEDWSTRRQIFITERLQYIFYNEPKPYSNHNPIN